MMARYIVFAGQAYYARGGAFDVIGVLNSLPLAIEMADQAIKPHEVEWSHVLDAETLQVIHQNGTALGQWSDDVTGQSVPLNPADDLNEDW